MSRDDGELILYRTDDGKSAIPLRAGDGTVWLTPAGIAGLFDATKQNVGPYLKNIFDDNELRKVSVVKQSLTTDTRASSARRTKRDAMSTLKRLQCEARQSRKPE